MNFLLRVPLNTTPDQLARLKALQTTFADVCNALSPMVQKTGIWNRVALHHLAYKGLRTQFPALGSQMVCNAIYSVSRCSRLIYQHPQSPFNQARLAGRPLPLLRFTHTCPVYFDRHTLSLKSGQLSMYTLDGRMRFQLALNPSDEAIFHEKKLREIVLSLVAAERFELSFLFALPDDAPEDEMADLDAVNPAADAGEIPEYVIIEEQQPHPLPALPLSALSV